MHDRPGLQIINPVKEPEPDKGSYELFPSDNKSRRPPPDHSKYLFLLENEPLTRDPRTVRPLTISSQNLKKLTFGNEYSSGLTEMI